MSMQLLTVLQFFYILLLYIGVLVVIPGLIFHRKFEGKSFPIRVMAYLIIGNFYVMNLVFLLELLHISCKATLLLGMIIPSLAVVAFMNWKTWVKDSLVNVGTVTHNVLVSSMGFKLFLSKIFQWFVDGVKNRAREIWESLKNYWLDWIGVILVMAMVFWQYGMNELTSMGYTASDMPVHNYWINALCKNDLFTAGIYPYGFHCIIYFFHAVFGMEVFVLLRLIGFIQTMLIHLILLAFLRSVCKNEAIPYLAVGIYLLPDIWGYNTYARYLFSLPQEYGMLFILPSICFLILFFRDRKEERGEKGFRNESSKMLFLFAMSFGMTLAVHFYDTIIAGLFCLAIAVGYLGVIFRKAYLWRILGFGILSILMAVLPMVIAYMMGKPLEGSLRWGMSIMRGTSQMGTPIAGPVGESAGDSSGKDNTSQADIAKNADGIAYEVIQQDNRQGLQEGERAPYEAPPVYKKPGLFQQIKNRFLQIPWKTLLQTAGNRLNVYIFTGKQYVLAVAVIFLCGIMILCGIGCLIFRQREYGSILITVSVNVLLLCGVMVAKELKLPALMDETRCSTYLAYSMVVLIGLAIDFVLFLAIGWSENEAVRRLVPAGIMIIGLIITGKMGLLRQPLYLEALEKNGAITCVTNILKQNKPKTFTIISANDELRMIEEYGFHYEVSELLWKCVGINEEGYESIPTPKVYVFVEKVPGEYGLKYDDSGRTVSRQGAMLPLPSGSGITMYQGKNRYVTMSKLYYWAQTLQKMYPNETSVYYEDEEFVCYEITQNVYRPFDLTFSYGYNNSGLDLQ